MSIPEVYITTGIKTDGVGGLTAASIRAQLTQFFDLKVIVPRMGYREAELRVNLLSSELAPLYAGLDTKFSTYSNFLYIKWRGQVVFWGAIITKDIDFDGRSLTIKAKDQGARLEHHYFRIGDLAMDVPGDITKGHLTVDRAGLLLCLTAGEIYVTAGRHYIPLGISYGTDDHTPSDPVDQIQIERGQEIWRTMQDLADRSDGPMFEFKPLSITDSRKCFAVMNTYGPYVRDDVSSTVKFHYRTGLNNIRNIRETEGGQVLSHTHVLTQDNQWRTTTYSGESAEAYGVWIQWQQVDFNLRHSLSEDEVNQNLGAVGDAILDTYGRPLHSVEITLRRDDQIQDSANQFYWLTNFQVGDIVEVQGISGPEHLTGKYTIDEVRLEQEGDGSGQVRQSLDVIPHTPVGLHSYGHVSDFITDDDMGSGSG